LHSAGRNKHNGPEEMTLMKYMFLFYGPVHLEGNRPFVITEREEVEKVFLAAKKQMFRSFCQDTTNSSF